MRPAADRDAFEDKGYDEGEDLLDYDAASLADVCSQTSMKDGHAKRFQMKMGKALGLASA